MEKMGDNLSNQGNEQFPSQQAQDPAEVTQPSDAPVNDQVLDPDILQHELEQSQAKAEEYLDGWQRSRAEFANYKKRVDRDQALLTQTITGNMIKRYLDVLDDLGRALKNRPQEGEGAAWANGIELIYRKLLTILENEGVKMLDPLGQQFDPNQHEALTLEDSSNHASGEIMDVIQPGYLLGDRVLRPALVRVAR